MVCSYIGLVEFCINWPHKLNLKTEEGILFCGTNHSYLLILLSVLQDVISLRKIQQHFCTKGCTCNLLHKIASSITSVSYFRTHRLLLYFEEVMKELKGSPPQLRKGLTVKLPGNLFVSQFTFRIRIVQLCFLQGIQCVCLWSD